MTPLSTEHKGGTMPNKWDNPLNREDLISMLRDKYSVDYCDDTHLVDLLQETLPDKTIELDGCETKDQFADDIDKDDIVMFVIPLAMIMLSSLLYFIYTYHRSTRK